MQRHTDNVQDLLGNAIDGVTVTIRRVSDSGLATIFSDDGVTPKANPFTNDVDGELFFYASNDRYNVVLSGPVAETREDVILFDQDDTVLRGPVLLVSVGGLSSNGEVILVDVTAGPITITLPAAPGTNLLIPDIVIQHHAGDITSNNITVARNGNLIGGLAADVVLSQTNQAVRLIWGGTVLGWAIQNPKEGIDVGTITGTSVDSPETPGGTWDGLLRFENANNLQTARVGFEPAGDTFFVQPTVEGGRLILGGRSPGAPGVLREAIVIDFDTGALPAGSMIFNEPNGTQAIMRLDTGVNAVTQVANSVNQPSGGFAQVGVFRVQNRNVSPEIAMSVGFDPSIGATELEIKNFVHGGAIQIVGETAAGVERLLFFTDPDQRGPIIFGLNDNTPVTPGALQDARITFRNPSAENIWQAGFLDTDDDFIIKSFQRSGDFELRGLNVSGVDNILFHGNPNSQVDLYFDGEVQFETQATGARIRGELNNDPDISNVQDVRFDMTNQSAQLVSSVFNSVLGLSIQNEVFGAAVNIAAREAGGVLRNLFQADPDGAAALWFQGVSVARTLAAANGGLEANNTLTGAGFERVLTESDAFSPASPFDINSAAAADPTLTLSENAVLSTTFLHDVSTDITLLRNEVNSGHLELRARSSGGVDRRLLTGDPDNQTILYWQDNLRVRTAQFGTEFIGSSASGSTLRFFGSNGTTLVGLMTIGGGGVNEIQLIANATNNGQAFRILLPDAGGTAREMFRADPDNAVDLSFAGVVTAETVAEGFAARSAAADPVFQLLENITLRATWRHVIATGVTEIRNREISGELEIRATNLLSADAPLIIADPDDDVELFDNSIGVIRTQQAGLGGAEVNNTLTGAGYERVLTLTDSDNLSIFTRNIADDVVASAVFVTGVLTITLEASSVYAFEFFFEFQTPNASGDDFVLRFDNSATWAGTAMVTCDNDAGQEFFTQQLAGAPATSITVNSDTTSNTICKGTGVIVTDGTGGTFELDVAKSADAGGDGTFFANSWMRVQKLA